MTRLVNAWVIFANICKDSNKQNKQIKWTGTNFLAI